MGNRRIYDLSQAYFDEMPYLPSIGPFKARLLFDLDRGPVQIIEYQLSTHTGTHLDAVRHFFKDGETIDQIPLERLMGRGVVVNAPKNAFELITVADVVDSGLNVKAGDFVLFKTGWGAKFGQPDYYDHPSLSVGLAEWLVGKGVGVVGVDFNGVDMPGSRRQPGFDFPIHRTLLKNRVLILENLNLTEAPQGELEVFCFPLNIKGADAAQVRVVGVSASC